MKQYNAQEAYDTIREVTEHSMKFGFAAARAWLSAVEGVWKTALEQHDEAVKKYTKSIKE